MMHHEEHKNNFNNISKTTSSNVVVVVAPTEVLKKQQWREVTSELQKNYIAFHDDNDYSPIDHQNNINMLLDVEIRKADHRRAYHAAV